MRVSANIQRIHILWQVLYFMKKNRKTLKSSDFLTKARIF